MKKTIKTQKTMLHNKQKKHTCMLKQNEYAHNKKSTHMYIKKRIMQIKNAHAYKKQRIWWHTHPTTA